MMTRRAKGLVVVALLSACGSPPIECCLVDSSAEVVALGTVSDGSSDPIGGAEIRPGPVLGFECSAEIYSIASVPPSALSDAAGKFSMRLMTVDGSGIHCVDLVVKHASAGGVDTVHDCNSSSDTSRCRRIPRR